MLRYHWGALLTFPGFFSSFPACLKPDWDPCGAADIGHLCVGIGMNQGLVLPFLHNWKQLNEQC